MASKTKTPFLCLLILLLKTSKEHFSTSDAQIVYLLLDK